MSLVLFLFYWVGIPILIYRATRGLLRKAKSPVQKVLVLALSGAVTLGLLWLAVGRIWWTDWQVRELCAKDGGVKVYETVRLPADKFNQWGQPNFYRPTEGKNALGAEYAFQMNDHYYRQERPTLIRHHDQVVRLSDGKLLGETVSYGRGGGGLPGPWFPSSYTCPDSRVAGPNALLKSVFVQSN